MYALCAEYWEERGICMQETGMRERERERKREKTVRERKRESEREWAGG